MPSSTAMRGAGQAAASVPAVMASAPVTPVRSAKLKMYCSLPSAMVAKPSPPDTCMHCTPSVPGGLARRIGPTGGPVVLMSSQSPSERCDVARALDEDLCGRRAATRALPQAPPMGQQKVARFSPHGAVSLPCQVSFL